MPSPLPPPVGPGEWRMVVGAAGGRCPGQIVHGAEVPGRSWQGPRAGADSKCKPDLREVPVPDCFVPVKPVTPRQKLTRTSNVKARVRRKCE